MPACSRFLVQQYHSTWSLVLAWVSRLTWYLILARLTHVPGTSPNILLLLSGGRGVWCKGGRVWGRKATAYGTPMQALDLDLYKIRLQE